MQKLPKILSREEYEKLLVYTIKKANRAKEKKEYYKSIALSLMLGFEAGMRISEIVGLKDAVTHTSGNSFSIQPLTKDKVNLVENTIRIEQGKGQKDRIVPLPKRVNANSLKLLPIIVSRRTLQRYVTDLGIRLLEKKISFHTLRHGFGSHLAASGRPLHEVQMLMGHSRLDTTGVYLHANPKKAIDGARDVF